MAEEFEKDKQGILKSLPDNIKDMFNVIGFSRVEHEDNDSDNEGGGENGGGVEDDYVPCLILSPFDVPPRPVRDVYWNSLYMTAKKKKKLQELEYLAYQYGADDPEDCYLFVAHDDFLSYEDGCEAGYDQLPTHIQDKVNAGIELTVEEAIRVRGLQEMKEDIKKQPQDRARGNHTFQERHEVASVPPPATKNTNTNATAPASKKRKTKN
jgi:hypothetical protein